MDKKGEYQHLKRTFGPIYDKNSEILILGSFPSVKSREANFFYGHPQNRFWKVISAVYNAPSLNTIEDKTNFLIKNKIALWDTIDSCDIIGSSDSSIKNAVPTNINMVLSSYVMGMPFDFIHAVSTVFFLFFAAEPMLEKLERIKIKYGLIE